MDVQSSPFQYRYIKLLSITSKFFEAIINKMAIEQLEKKPTSSAMNSIGYYPDPFHCRSPTITQRIISALDDKQTSRTITLDISKPFDRVWHKGLVHMLSSYEITGRLISIINSFLTGRSLKGVINGHSSVALVVNADVTQRSLLERTLIVIINDLDKYIRRTFVNLYADAYL